MHQVGPAPIISPSAHLAVSAWEEWKASIDFKPLLCEQAVWSHKHEYAGTMDLLAEINGRVTLIDWKTGKSVYREAFLQNAAYRVAMIEMGLLPNQVECDGLIVRLPKLETDPTFEAVKVTEDMGALFEVFMHTKRLWEWTQKDEELTESPEVRADVSLQDPIGTNGPTETMRGRLVRLPSDYATRIPKELRSDGRSARSGNDYDSAQLRIAAKANCWGME